MSPFTGGIEGLSAWQQRLEKNFTALRLRRDSQAGAAFPIFALEHALSGDELKILSGAVRAAITRRHLPRLASLPFVVYAAELGYEYCGDEYWQTFEARTPGWAELNDRDYIRRSFFSFAAHFGGARPAGRWAEQFSIICWPITHAVLPTDLQRQLVRLIFDYRTGLTADLLADPPALGLRLAARAGYYSARFQYFAQNTKILGQVAAALLVADEGPSPYLLESTLKRIVERLSVHQQSRLWLRDAKTTANRVRMSGFRPVDREHQPGQTGESLPRLPAATDPDIFLELSDRGWAAYLELPDLSPLAERLPELHEHLARYQVTLAGRRDAPLARSRLLVPGQRVRLESWPAPEQPLLQFAAAGMEVANRLLADQCVLSPGPVWLFRVREPGLAVEVKGKFVRPGYSYVLLTRATLSTETQPDWMTPVTSATTGVSAYAFSAPAVLKEPDIAKLQSLGLGVVVDVSVRPAGVVPGGWDGDGAAEWLAGEDVILAVSSGRSVANCFVSIDGHDSFLNWPAGRQEVFLCLSGLGIGTHQLRVALMAEAAAPPLADGSFLIGVRAAQARPLTGSVREGLMLLANPPVPTLGEVWDGRAVVELSGPPGVELTATATLEGHRGVVLSQRGFRIRAPLDAAGWLAIVTRELRGWKQLQSRYDDAEALVFSVSHPDLGSTELRCEREYSPLRWIVGMDRDGPYARLIDNTEGPSIGLVRYDFASPTKATPLGEIPSSGIRWPAGGLFSARTNAFEASVILPPLVRDLSDLQHTRVVPHVAMGPRSVDRIVALVQASKRWSAASLPGNPFARHERQAVLRTLTARLVSILAGNHWSELEDRGLADDAFVFQQLQQGVGEETYQRGLADALRRQVGNWHQLEPAKRTVELAAVLGLFQHRTFVEATDYRFAELLLRLASDPGSLTNWPDTELRKAVERLLALPVLIRVARFVVLAIHLDEEEETGSVYRGWSWT